MLREIWTSFNLEIAGLGLIALFEAIFFSLVQLVSLAAPVQGDFYGSLSVAVWLFRSGFFLLQLSLFLAGNGDGLLIPLLHFSLLLSIGYHAVVLCIQLLSLQFQWKPLIPFIIAAAHSFSFLSNSFIVYEPSVVRFCLQTVMICSLLMFLKKMK